MRILDGLAGRWAGYRRWRGGRWSYHPRRSARPALDSGTGRWRCWVGGHADILAFDPTRVWLRCLTCGRETHGWQIGRTPSGEPW